MKFKMHLIGGLYNGRMVNLETNVPFKVGMQIPINECVYEVIETPTADAMKTLQVADRNLAVYGNFIGFTKDVNPPSKKDIVI